MSGGGCWVAARGRETGALFLILQRLDNVYYVPVGSKKKCIQYTNSSNMMINIAPDISRTEMKQAGIYVSPTMKGPHWLYTPQASEEQLSCTSVTYWYMSIC